jgi:peptidyl-prolyl cis-trans isomerase B (cyclophilin B)
MKSTVLAPMSLALLLALVGCSSATDSGEVAAEQSPSAQASPSQSPTVDQPAFCEPATAIGREATSVGTPTDLLEKQKYILTLVTNCGELEITADAAAAPATVTTIGFLANNKYYDQTVCHRLTTSGIFVVQCGDPTATGAGGPGFSFKDENLPSASGVNYPKGTVAMANSGPNTNGSQFFLVYQDTTLPPNYTVWGSITKGLDMLEKIAALGTVDGGPDGNPKFTIEIRSARLS